MAVRERVGLTQGRLPMLARINNIHRYVGATPWLPKALRGS